jgi:3-deoxy-D-manno-octulosonate 8-phosphate phosphatase (KDO 8-P phosphatase)
MGKNTSIRAKLRKIRLLLLDVDGVMTDGGIYYSNSGEEFKKFNIQDGYGIRKLQGAGIGVGVISGRESELVKKRTAELGISEVHLNIVNKLEAYESLKKRLGLSDSEIAFIGDDEFDLEVLEKAGFSAAPANALPLVKKRTDYVCRNTGGNGAIRELIELILQMQK